MKTIVLNGWAAGERAWSLCETVVSHSPETDATVFSYTDQLEGKAEEAMRSVDSAIVVGWSMGGSRALKLAIEFPEKIRGLVLLAATPRMMEDRECTDPALANTPSGVWRGMTPRRLAALQEGFRLTRGEGLFGMPPGRVNPYEFDSEENLARGIEYLRATDDRRALLELSASGKSKFPVYVFHCERDGIVRPENASFLARVFPQAAVEMLPGAEHALPVVIPDRIDAALRELSYGRR